MSGIAGIVALDGASPTASQIEAMTAPLARRGPDGTHILVQNQAALGHTLLATTPEALVEVLPLTDDRTGCTITADARLDNRDELMIALNLTQETRIIGDGELILRSYLKWGEQSPTKLLGDFAFAIWDPRSASLFCARDQIGMRQLIYHHEVGRRFVFATEPVAILALPDFETPLNYDRIGDFLSNMEGADLTSTFFSGVFRLPPAYILRVDRCGVVLRRYWEWAPEPIISLPSDGAYAEAFLAVFTEAVRCRLRNAGSIGAMVSGGIDSNSVAAVAAKLLASESRGPLATFSAIGPNASECVETRAIIGAIRTPEFAPTTVCYNALGSLRAELMRGAAEADEPFDGNMDLIRAIYLAARDAGTNVVLDGVQSDVLLSSYFHMGFLFRQGKLKQLVREAEGAQQFWGPRFRVWRALLAAAWQAFAPTAIRGVRFRMGRRKADKQFLALASAIVPSLDLPRAVARRKCVQQHDFDNMALDSFTRVRGLSHPNVVVGRERYDRVAGAYGIEPRDPFMDLRLIRFCLSLPRTQLQRNGWPKWILRQAMASLITPDILWRGGRKHLGTDFTRAVIGGESVLGPQTSSLPDTIKRGEHQKRIFLLNWFAYRDRVPASVKGMTHEQ